MERLIGQQQHWPPWFRHEGQFYLFRCACCGASHRERGSAVAASRPAERWRRTGPTGPAHSPRSRPRHSPNPTRRLRPRPHPLPRPHPHRRMCLHFKDQVLGAVMAATQLQKKNDVTFI